MTPTNEEIEALKAKAEAATAGPWEAHKASRMVDDAFDFAISSADAPVLAEVWGRCTKGTFLPAEKNAAFIADANPATVLSLISTITQLRARVEAAELKGWNEAIEAAEYAVFGVSSSANESQLAEILEPVCDAIRALKKEPSK